jgi:hypothetical protein
MSYETKTVRLPDGLSRSEDLRFVDAVLFETPHLPFAIVHYSAGRGAEELGLRLDLGKQVFLDHFEDAGTEALASAAAREIVSYLGTRAETVSATAHAY